MNLTKILNLYYQAFVFRMSQRTLAGFGIPLSTKRKLVIDENESKKLENKQTIKAKTPKSSVFQTTWLNQFDWLEFDEKNKRIFC